MTVTKSPTSGTTQSKPRVMGIDVGTAITGWSIIEKDPHANNGMKLVNYGAILTQAGEKMPARLEKLYSELSQLMDLYQPQEIAIESLFFFKNQTTVMTVSQARGVILLAAQMHKLSIFEYTPLQVKQAVTGFGRAEKAQVQNMVKMIMGMTEIPKPDDAADAIAIGICQIQTASFMDKVNKAKQ